MLEAWIEKSRARHGCGERRPSPGLRITGRTESHAEEAPQPLYEAWQRARPPVRATILAALGTDRTPFVGSGLGFRRSRRAREGGRATSAPCSATTSSATMGNRWRRSSATCFAPGGWTLAIAESCTGGLIDVPAHRCAWKLGLPALGVVSYSNASKIDVPRRAGGSHRGARRGERTGRGCDGHGRSRARARATSVWESLALPGPAAAPLEKPVGTVVVAVAPDGIARVPTHPAARRPRAHQVVGGAGGARMIRRMLTTEGART